jgi:hypothetical protein
MQTDYRRADISWQSDTVRILTPLIYLVYSSAVIVLIASVIYAARLLIA